MIDGHRAPCDEGVLAAGAAPTPCAEREKTWTLVATILGSSMAFIVGSVVNVALPAIQGAFGASAAEMQWVLNAYLLFLGALILVGGSAGDHFGRRRVFSIGIVVFTAASVACGLAPSVTALILARGVQGVGGALLVPSSLAILSTVYDKQERGKAIGTWSGFSALTTAFGPVLGGWLVDAGSWRWVFFIVVPLAVLTLALTWWRMPETRDEEARGGLDWAGAALATLGLGALVYGLIASSEAGWGSAPVLAALLDGAVLLSFFLWVEGRRADPMMPLGLFRSRTFSGANLMTLLLYFALNGALFFLPFNLIQVQNYSATAAGAAFLPFTVLMGGLSRWAGGLVDRYGAKRPLVIGPVIAAAGLAVLALPGTDGSYWTTFFPALLVLGFGLTVSVAPLTTVVMNAVEDHQAGVASGVNNAAARVAGLLAIAILGVVAVGVFSGALNDRLAGVAAPVEAKEEVLAARDDLAGITLPAGLSEEHQEALTAAIDAAFVRSFRWVMGLAAALALASALTAAWLIEPREATGDAATRAG